MSLACCGHTVDRIDVFLDSFESPFQFSQVYGSGLDRDIHVLIITVGRVDSKVKSL